MDIFNYRLTRLILLIIIVFGIFYFGKITQNMFIAYFYGGVRAVATDPLILIPALIIGAIVPRDLYVIIALIIFGFIFSLIINSMIEINFPFVHYVRIYAFLCVGYFARSIRFLIIKK
tara:strand:+ start:315 stop:668 length:354 start_codon:yes stop_codon:yes gene_type:complete